MPIDAISPEIHPVLSELSGTVLESRYELGRVLGAGGMGAVFEATHLRLDRQVAIKVLRPVFVGHDEFIKRFLREAKAASKIRHRNVVEILDFGEAAGGLVYSVMELLHGMDLDQLLRARTDGRLPWSRACGLLAQIAAGLKAAHACGVIHRDIKPANCFLTREDDEQVVKVVDFGIAKIDEADQSQKLTGTTDMLGTPSYIAPELVRTKSPASPRSDVYSLGVLAYRMLTGRLPFTGETTFEVLHRSCFEPPRPLREHVPEIPPAIEGFVLSLLAKQPEDRPQDMLVVRDRMLALGCDASVSLASPPSASPALAEAAPRAVSPPSEFLTLPRAMAASPTPPSTPGWAALGTAIAPPTPAPAALESTWVAVERMAGGAHELTIAPFNDPATVPGTSDDTSHRPRRARWLVTGSITSSLVLGAVVVPRLGLRDEAGEPPAVSETSIEPVTLHDSAEPRSPAPSVLVPPLPSESRPGPPSAAVAPAEPETGAPSPEPASVSSPATEPVATPTPRTKRASATTRLPSDTTLVGRLERKIRSSCASRASNGPVRVSFLVLPNGMLSGLASIPATSELGKCAVQQIKGTQFRSRSEASPVSFEVE